MGKIVVAGSINMDVVTQAERLPKPGETLFGHDLHYIPGGKGSNQAVAASRLSDAVYLVGKLGRDPFGDALTTFLNAERLNLSYLGYDDKAPTGIALITVDDASENTIVVISGSNFEVSSADVEAVSIDAEDTVVSVFEIPQETIRTLFERAKAVGARTVLN
ncbi:MAG: PfkB family carbohydrate kinase, partial [Chloroflexota bacterium]